jgi:hypothetical protein
MQMKRHKVNHTRQEGELEELAKQKLPIDSRILRIE